MSRKMLLFFVYALLVASSSSFKTISNDSYVENIEKNEKVSSEIQSWFPEEAKADSRKWISQLFAEAKTKFDMTNVNSKCEEDFRTYKAHLNDNQSIWAVRMMESSEWPSTGILAGVTFHPGHWKECINVDRGTFKGQYCVVQSTLITDLDGICSQPTLQNSARVPDDCSAWDLIKNSEKNANYLPRNELNWAICIPSSCSSTELQTSLTDTLDPIFERNNISIKVKVDPIYCQTKEEIIEYPASFTYTRNFFFLLLFIVVAASVYDLLRDHTEENNNCGWPMIIFKSFSVKQTISDLVHQSTSTNIKSVFIFKLLMTCNVIAGHRMLFTYSFPAFQTEELEMRPDINTDSLDTFFLISGFLMYLQNSKLFKTNGTRQCFLFLIFRYLRIIPTYMLMVAFLANIIFYLGDGPLWQPYLSRRFLTCQSIWWMNLLLINNVQVQEGMCYYVTWHLAVDFQLSVVGAVLLLVLTKNPKLGKLAFVAAFLLSATAVGYRAYRLNFTGYFNINLRYMRKTFMHVTDKSSFYLASYPRLNPYLLGMGTAMLVTNLKEKKFKFSPLQVLLLITSTFYVRLWTQSYGLSLLKQDLSIVDIIYASLYRSTNLLLTVACTCIFSVGIASSNFPTRNKEVIVISGNERKIETIRQENPVNYKFVSVKKLSEDVGKSVKCLLSWKGFIPLARLTFSAFLTSSAFQWYQIYTQRNNVSTNRFDSIIAMFRDIIVSFTLAFFLYLISEGPVNRIVQEVKRRTYAKTRQNKED